jgi:rhodanese-related sulfurtransferase
MNTLKQRVEPLLWIGIVLLIAFWLRAQSIDTSGVRDVSINEAKALIDAGAIVIDVRSGDAFDHRHIPGALYISVETLESSIASSIAGAKDKPVVVYCSEGTNRGRSGT